MLRSCCSLLCTSVLALGCGAEVSALPEDDAAADGAASDALTAPSDIVAFDVQALDRGVPAPEDTGNPPPSSDGGSGRDLGSVTPADSGAPGSDSGGGTPGMSGVCPASCSTNANCDSCWRLGEMRVGNYCCSSGLCIYRADTCGAPPPPPPPPPPGGRDGGLGGADGGGGGLDAGGTGGRDGGSGVDSGSGSRDAGGGVRDSGSGGGRDTGGRG